MIHNNKQKTIENQLLLNVVSETCVSVKTSCSSLFLVTVTTPPLWVGVWSGAILLWVETGAMNEFWDDVFLQGREQVEKYYFLLKIEQVEKYYFS